MERWRKIRLGDFCVTNADSYSPREEWGFVNYLDTGNITNNTIDSIQYIDIKSEKLPSRARRKVKRNSIIYSTVRPNQRHFGIIKSQPENFLVSTGFAVIDVNTNVLDADFLYYLLTQDALVEALHAIAEQSTSAYPSIKPSDLENLEIEIPDLDTQRKIADVLSSLDRKITQNTDVNENLQQQVFALFDQLMLESGDSKCLVSDVAYLNPKRQLSKNQVARCIDMSQLSTSGAFPSGWDMKPFNGGMRFINGDTLLARITPCLENGKTAYIDFLDKKEVAFGSTEYIVLAPREGVPPEYLYCLARYPAFVDYAVKNMNGSSGRQRVSADTIGKFVMNHPSEDALRNFGDIATALFMKMRYNSFENLRLVSLRDAILPRLMSGELDVSGLDL